MSRLASAPKGTLEHAALRAPRTIEVESPAFEEGAAIPRVHTGFGRDVSPHLAWGGMPDGTESIALVVDDPDAPGGTFTHWLVWDLPADLEALEEGADVEDLGGIEGENDFGRTGYNGPKPPSGTHRYRFRVFALDDEIGLPPNADAEEVWAALEGHVLAWGERTGTFTKP